MFGVCDPIRDSAKQVITGLGQRGWMVCLLSGDNQSIVTQVAAKLGISKEMAIGDRSPEQKLSAIEDAKAKGTVVMVGDGVNDAAALAAADVGVAIRGGASVSLAAAPILIGNGHLPDLLTLVKTAGRTSSTIRKNFVVSISYNAIAAALAVAGLINPLIAAVLMPISSLTVLGMTLATRSVEEATNISGKGGHS